VSPGTCFRSTIEIETQEELITQHRRIEMKKFLIVAGLLTVIATPAFAQSFVPEYGTANELPFTYASNGNTQMTAHTKAELANASADEIVNRDPDSPANTGGGSEGYNWDLSHIQAN
jgi:opacity protein-like surface antigen